MNAVTFEHVPFVQLPVAWREKFASSLGAQFKVRIEQEEPVQKIDEPHATNNPLFGMWQDRSDLQDVSGFVRNMRQDRWNAGIDSSSN